MPEDKLDLSKLHPADYKSKKTPEIVDLEPGKYLAIEGQGAPESAAFQAAIGALYGVAYTVKMTRKFAGRDFKVATLEGLWWAEYDRAKLADPEALWTVPRDAWRWKVLIRQPEFVTAAEVETAKAAVLKKKGDETVTRVALETLREGKCVQILHVGPYAAEPESIAKMRALMAAQGLAPHGLHHEIYLSDPRRVPPERLKTILRQPVT